MVANDGTIYVNCSTSFLNAVDPRGAVKWWKEIEWTLTDPMIREDGSLLSVGDTVFLIDPDDGRITQILEHHIGLPVVWEELLEFDLPIPVGLEMVIVRARYYMDALAGKVSERKTSFLALDTQGSLLWEREFTDDVVANPSLASNGTIYILCANGKLLTLDQSGQVLWEYSAASGYFHASPVIGMDGTAYLFGLGTSQIHAVNSHGRQRFVRSITPRKCLHLAVNHDGRFYAALLEKQGGQKGASRYWLAAFLADGTDDWEIDLQGYALITIDGAGIVYFTQPDGLYAYDPDGQQKWFLSLPKVDQQPVVGSDGTIYVVSRDGYLNAIGEAN